MHVRGFTSGLRMWRTPSRNPIAPLVSPPESLPVSSGKVPVSPCASPSLALLAGEPERRLFQRPRVALCAARALRGRPSDAQSLLGPVVDCQATRSRFAFTCERHLSRRSRSSDPASPHTPVPAAMALSATCSDDARGHLGTQHAGARGHLGAQRQRPGVASHPRHLFCLSHGEDARATLSRFAHA